MEEYAEAKLKSKNLNYIIGNYVGKNEKGFGEADTTVFIYSAFGKLAEIGPFSKEVVSEKIVEFLKKETSKSFISSNF